MPKITQYEVPSAQSKLRPSPDAFAAFETAARRIGPLLNQASQDYEKIGRVQAAGIKAQDFPLDFAALAPPKVILEGGGGGSSGRSGGGGRGGAAAAARSPSTRGGGGGGGQAGEPVAAAAKLIDGWGLNTPDIAPGVTLLRGGNEAERSGGPPGTLLNPGAIVRGDVTDEGIPGVMTPDSQGNTPSGVEPQFGAAGNPNLAAVPGFDALMNQVSPTAPPLPEGSWWSGIGSAVSSAVSTVGAAVASSYGDTGIQ